MTTIRQSIPRPQVDRSIYFGPGYISPARFASYAYQLKEVMALKPKRVLEVGIGNGLVSCMLGRAGLDVTTLDFDPSLGPDIVASVTDMPVGDGSFDVVACFEVLEHLPFELFPRALAELRRASSAHVILSLPDLTRIYKAEVTLPRLGPRRLSLALPFVPQRTHAFDGEHHWEIGVGGCSLRKVRDCLEGAGLTVRKCYRIWESLCHRMFATRVSV
jgi:2-polyprenyl-3-methyl-5-hydroxy-6-metoxy-1,4-benzoquinol methylase